MLPDLSNAPRHDPGPLLADAHLFEMMGLAVPRHSSRPNLDIPSYLDHVCNFLPSDHWISWTGVILKSWTYPFFLPQTDEIPKQVGLEQKGSHFQTQKARMFPFFFQMSWQRVRYWNLECGLVWGVIADEILLGWPLHVHCPCPRRLMESWQMPILSPTFSGPPVQRKDSFVIPGNDPPRFLKMAQQ